MEKAYQHQNIEAHWQQQWEQLNIGKPSGVGDSYCIVIPPPNVTGTLHMGHGFQLTLMDCLIRYHRMNGYNTLWQVGTDHAGIATQMVVERQLQQQGQSRTELGRDAFTHKVWQWKEQSGQTILKQMRRLGASVDWSRERFTLDEQYSDVVKKVFVDLYQKGLIFRGKRLVNWDPKLMTAVSDLEVVNEEKSGHLWHIKYPIHNQKNRFIVIATTRPETMLGDQAIAVNPNDERYQDLIGLSACLPLTDRLIPIIADSEVDVDFGTGCVKITPAHDFNDYAMGQRHQLSFMNILTADGCLNEQVPEAYQGLERFAARKKIVADLEALKLVEKIEPHNHMVPVGDRSGAVLEPFLTDQWFVHGEKLAKPALAAVANGDIDFIPENWVNTYNHWLNNIQDWCISRRLWWGHRIPAWYNVNTHEVYVGLSEQDVRERHQLNSAVELRQEEDVLDTWFSSALWPFATLGWPENTAEMRHFYPNNVLVTGFDIIFFWVARMIMMGLECTGEKPFSEVYITGLIRDFQGKKMSKSKGNVIDPLDLIDGIDLESLVSKRTANMMQQHLAQQVAKRTRKEYPDGINAYGTDALRFTFCALASTGRDIRFDIQRLEGYRNFCNKLWNASRFVLGQIQDDMVVTTIDTKQLNAIDLWILDRLHQTTTACHEHIKIYRFDLYAKDIYEFVWHDYCDWYLELSKNHHTACNQQVLVKVLDHILKLLHPITPFITEEIWALIRPLTGQTHSCLALAPYPQVEPNWHQPQACEEVEWLQTMITQIRTLRSDLNIGPNQSITLMMSDLKDFDQQRLNIHQETLMHMLKISTLQILDADQEPPVSATTMVGTVKCLLPLAGLINEQDEITRLDKAIVKLTKKITQAQHRLENPHYCNNSPQDVVEKLRADYQSWHLAIDKYKQQIDLMKQLLQEQQNDQ